MWPGLVGPAQRGDESSPRAPNRARAAVAPGAPARRRGSATSAPQGDTATIERQNPIAMLANAAPPRQSTPAALLDGARAGAVPSGAHAATSAAQLAPVARLDGARSGGAPSGAHAATSAPKSVPAALLDGARAGGVPSGTPATTAALQSAPAALLDGARAGGAPSDAHAATSAPQSAPAALLDGARAGGAPSDAHAATSAPKFASGALADGSHAGRGVPGSPVATAAPERALGVSPDGGPPDASAGAAAHPTRDSVHSRHQSPPRRHIPAAVRRHIWQRDGGRCCYRDPLSGRRCTSSHLLQIDHLLPVAQGGGPEPSNLVLRCFAHHRMRHGYGPAAPPEPPM